MDVTSTRSNINATDTENEVEAELRQAETQNQFVEPQQNPSVDQPVTKKKRKQNESRAVVWEHFD